MSSIYDSSSDTFVQSDDSLTGKGIVDMSGLGWWSDFTDWVSDTAEKVNQGLQDTKILSKLGKALTPLSATLGPEFPIALGLATSVAEQSGYGNNNNYNPYESVSKLDLTTL